MSGVYGRRLLGLACVAVVTTAAAAASAETPKYADLPKVAFGGPPAPSAKKPTFIPAREQVPGFHLASPKFPDNVPAGSRHVTVNATQSEADALRKGEFFNSDESAVCFAESSRAFAFGEDDEEAATDWDASQMSQVHLWPKSKENPQAGVAAVHRERFVEKDGVAALETADAWVDPSTRGVRLIAKATVPLKLVGTAMGGLRVFAARDERANGKKNVQFLFVRPSDARPEVRGQGMMAILGDGNGTHGSGCQHLRVALPVADKGGESAIVTTTIELPTLASDDEEDKKAEAPIEREATAKAKPRKRGAKPRREPSAAGPALGPPEEHEIRLREVQANISVSKATRDPEPLLSVSFGWSGRETVQRVLESRD